MSESKCKIKTTDEPGIYEGLRALWCEVFGDEPEYVDAFYDNFGEDIKGYAVTDESGRVTSALTCYLCGSFRGQPAYVSYAVCTAEDKRRCGLGAMLVSHVRENILKKGGVSIISPAEPSLAAWYAGLGYEPYFFAPRFTIFAADDDGEYEDFGGYDIDIAGSEAFEPFDPGIRLKPADRDTYNKYREAFLSNRPHVELSSAMLRLIESGCGDDGGLFIINGGDAICDMETVRNGSLVLSEFILSPVLEELSLEIAEEITGGIARQMDAYEVTYTAPGSRGCQSMAAGVEPFDYEEEGYEYSSAYFGFPIE